MTWSIVARDPKTGYFGIAIASRFFAVGALCPWTEAKVGALLQAFGEEDGARARETAPEPRANGAVPGGSDDELAHGPQLPDHAISQDDVDAILASYD